MIDPVPGAALENHIAILGKTGSGKTSTAKLIVERLIEKTGTGTYRLAEILIP